MTGPARTLLDVCAVGDDLEALTALDEIRRLRLATWDDLWATRHLLCGRGRPGADRYRRTLATRGGRRVPDTLFARLFLLLLAEAGLPEPDAELAVVAGGRKYRLDLAYRAERLAVELDGRGHLAERAFEADRARDARLAAAGWRVLRYTWRRFQDQPIEIAGEIRAALAGRPV